MGEKHRGQAVEMTAPRCKGEPGVTAGTGDRDRARSRGIFFPPRTSFDFPLGVL